MTILKTFILSVVQPSTRNMVLKGKSPKLRCAFVAPSASVIGDVTIGENSSVWYEAVIRGNILCHAVNVLTLL
jgi:carbonic anhydrase/acetyltransferase-like protein (isoleucine patch superfamily)